MEQERILLIATSDILYDQRLQKVAAALQEFGASTTLLGRKQINSKALQKKAFAQKRLTCRFNKGILFYVEINIRFFFFILFSSFTKVCANDADTLPAAYFAHFFKSFTLYFDAHELFTDVPELEHKKLKKKIWAKVQQVGLKRVQKAYTVNESLASILKERYNKAFEVVKNVPVLQQNTTKPKPKKYMLYQGAVNKGRGLEELIEVIKTLDYQLWIAGEGDLSATLKRNVQDLALENKVKFLGKITPDQLLVYTQEAYIGVNLLNNSSKNYYYSLANKFFDYAHAGLPQICMNFPEYKTINASCEVALLVADLKPESLKNALDKLYDDTVYYNKLKENSKAFKAKYNWQKEKGKLKQIYDLA